MAGTDSPLQSVHTTTLPQLLDQLRSSVLVSTYQAGKLIMVRADGGVANTHFRNFDTPMGLAHENGRLIVGTRTAVWEFRNQPPVAAKLDPAGKHDACYLPKTTHHTGQIAGHEIGIAGDGTAWVVNTRFSCLCTLHPQSSFVPRWRPPFVTALSPEDRCHLNGLALVGGSPRYATALGATDSSAAWRADKARGGVLMELPSGRIIRGGLSMPHSPRWYEGRLWFLESGDGTLSTMNPETGETAVVARLPGFTRGLDFYGPFAFIGLSQVRESALFAGLPLTDRLPVEERKCGLWVVDVRNGQTVAFLEFKSGVQEVFAVLVLPGVRFPELLNEGGEVEANAFLLPDEALKDVPPA